MKRFVPAGRWKICEVVPPSIQDGFIRDSFGLFHFTIYVAKDVLTLFRIHKSRFPSIWKNRDEAGSTLSFVNQTACECDSFS